MIEIFEYDGKKYPFRISWLSLEMTQKLLGLKQVTEIDTNEDAKRTLFKEALILGHKYADKKFNIDDISASDLDKMLDLNYYKFTYHLWKYFNGLVAIKNKAFNVDDVIEEPPKKK